MITNISVMPDHETSVKEASFLDQSGEGDKIEIYPEATQTQKNHFLFAYSTADGYIKVQNTRDSFPMYSYQSISVRNPLEIH
jgi:hypothetical protein